MSGYWPNETFIVVDTETTGLDFTTDRVIEVGIAVFREGQYIHGFNWLVNNGVPSHPDALATHGITDESRERHGTLPQQVFRETATLVNQMRKYKKPVIAFNAPFDFMMLRAEWNRAHIPFYVDDLNIVDPLVIDRHFETKIPIFTKPYMRLGQMAARYGCHAPKHRALDDAIATGHIAIAQSLHHSSIRRMSPHDLMLGQERWYYEWSQKFLNWGQKKGIQFTMPTWPFGNDPFITPTGSPVSPGQSYVSTNGEQLSLSLEENSQNTDITSLEV